MRRALRTSLLAALCIGVETLASLVPGVDLVWAIGTARRRLGGVL